MQKRADQRNEATGFFMSIRGPDRRKRNLCACESGLNWSAREYPAGPSTMPRIYTEKPLISTFSYLPVSQYLMFSSSLHKIHYGKWLQDNQVTLANLVKPKLPFLCILIGLISVFLFSLVEPVFAQTGTASYYTRVSCLKEGTSGIMANGQPLDDNAFSCASWDYPFGTRLKITYEGKSIIVLVTDRGPSRRLYRKGRIIDLSAAAFQALAPLSKGIITVTVEEVN
jgi:hypothetical protein